MTAISIGANTFTTVGQLDPQKGARDPVTKLVTSFGYGYGSTPGQLGVLFQPAAAQILDLSYGAPRTVTLGAVSQSEGAGAGLSASDNHSHPYINPNGGAAPDPLAGTDEAGKTRYSRASSNPLIYTGPPDPATTQLFGWYSQYEGTDYSGTVAADNTILSGNNYLDGPLSFNVTDGGFSQPLSFLAVLGRNNGATPPGTGTVTIQHGYLADPDVDYRLAFGSQTVKFANGDSLKVAFDTVSLANNPDSAKLTASFLLSGPPPAYGIAATDAAKARASSGTTPFTFTVTRTGDTSAAATLSYAVSGSGANPATASDFAGGVLPSGSVGFPAGASASTITINVAADAAAKVSDGFTVALSAPPGTTVTTSTASGTIQPAPAPITVAALVSAYLSGGLYSAPAVAAAGAALTAAAGASGAVQVASAAAGTSSLPPALSGALYAAVITAPVAGSVLALPSGYGALVAQGGNPVTLSDAGAAGAILVGNAGGGTLASTGSNATLIGGQGTNTFNVAAGSATVVTGGGKNTVAASGSAAVKVTTGTGSSLVQLAGGPGTVSSNGQDTVFGGSGACTVTAAQGLTAVGGDGQMTFLGGSATSVVFGGKGGVIHKAGSAYEVLVGGAGALDAQGGTGGGQFWGNSGADVLRAGSGATTVLVATKGGHLVSAGAQGNFLVAGGGNVVLDGSAASGSDVFFGGTGQSMFLLGSGNDLVGTGTGTSTVQLGAGKDTVFAFGTSTITSGTGSADIVMGGAVQLNLAQQAAGGAARTFALFNFVPGTDRIHLSGYDAGAVAGAIATQANSGSGTTLTLPGNTAVLLIGTQYADAGFFG